jgi:hypothetical protein
LDAYLLLAFFGAGSVTAGGIIETTPAVELRLLMTVPNSAYAQCHFLKYCSHLVLIWQDFSRSIFPKWCSNLPEVLFSRWQIFPEWYSMDDMEEPVAVSFDEGGVSWMAGRHAEIIQPLADYGTVLRSCLLPTAPGTREVSVSVSQPL